MELWTTRIPSATGFAEVAARAEAAGWDGITVTDSQNLAPDPFVALALASQATSRLRFATGVTNAHTRHPAALASAAATVQEASKGRFTLGIGRGDTALFHLGLPPMPIAAFFGKVEALQTYLGGGTIDIDGMPSRVRWLSTMEAPKVPLDIAASGPKVISFAARVAEQVTLAVGADPERLAWAVDHARGAAADAGRDPSDISFGAFVNVGCHPDPAVAHELISGGVAAFAHFSAMPGSTAPHLRDEDRHVVEEIGRAYDSRQHLRNDATHTQVLKPEFVDRFAVVGPPNVCADRLRELAELGIERFVITGAGFGADREAARLSNRLVLDELLPSLREA